MNRTVKLLAFTTLALLGAASALAVDVAKVNNRTITDADVKASLSSFNEGQRKQILNDMSTRREIVNNLIDQELIIQEAEKQKLDKDSEYEAAFRAFRRQFLTERVLARNVRTKMTPAAVKKFYENNKRNYSTDKVQVQHILVSDEKTARDLLAKAKGGADFQKLAEQFSKDPSAKNNRGDVGVITRDAPFVDEFKNAAFNASEGEVVGPVKTQFGYHVIKVVDKQPGKVLGFEEVESKVRADLQREMVQAYVVSLKKGATVTVDDKGVASLR
jgi:peptidyl-prolyl cis-trans isomerase C